jgi:transposase
MVEAMIHVLRTGCPWRDLPAHFGPWSSVYTRWRRWCQALLWPQILDMLAEQAHGTLECLDATHIKVHQDAANPQGGQQNQAIGRTKGGLNTKLTARVDAKGRALQLSLAPGQRADVVAAEDQVFAKGKCVVADKGYDSDKFREHIGTLGGSACIPARAGRRSPSAHHAGYYRRRHRVENFFQRIKRFRRIGTRYDKTDFHFLNFVFLAAILDWLT